MSTAYTSSRADGIVVGLTAQNILFAVDNVSHQCAVVEYGPSPPTRAAYQPDNSNRCFLTNRPLPFLFADLRTVLSTLLANRFALVSPF